VDYAEAEGIIFRRLERGAAVELPEEVPA
jgi:hypothetical protein